MSKPILLLVDGSSFLYRAFHAMPDLRGPDGAPTGAVHGFVAMMTKLRDDIGAEHAACVFDAKGPTFRDEWYPEYKGASPAHATRTAGADRAHPRGRAPAGLAGAGGARH